MVGDIEGAGYVLGVGGTPQEAPGEYAFKYQFSGLKLGQHPGWKRGPCPADLQGSLFLGPGSNIGPWGLKITKN